MAIAARLVTLLRHDLLGYDSNHKVVCHRVNVIAVPETIPWPGRIQSGRTGCLLRRRPTLLLPLSTSRMALWTYLSAELSGPSALVRIMGVRNIKRPERRRKVRSQSLAAAPSRRAKIL